MTQIQFVREYFPLASERDADYILWSMTAYPVCGLDHTRTQLAEVRAAVGNPRKRGWHRKLWNVARQYDEQMQRDVAEICARDERLRGVDGGRSEHPSLTTPANQNE